MALFRKTILFIGLIAIVFSPWLSASEDKAKEQIVLAVDDKAPAFEAKDEKGNVWKYTDHVGKNILVVYFYPAAMTGGCTIQACSFRDDRDDLTNLGVYVVGISGDHVGNLRIFKKVHHLNFTLLSDAKGEIARKFGVPVKKGGSIVRNIEGLEVEMTREITTARWTFIIDKDGKIIYKNKKVKAVKDSKNVIAFIKKHRDLEKKDN